MVKSMLLILNIEAMPSDYIIIIIIIYVWNVAFIWLL